MKIHQIRLYPDPILRQPCQPLSLEEIRSDGIQQLIEEMMATMYHFEGTVGLAAPQVGSSVRILVMDATAKTSRDGYRVMINPVILQQSQWKYSREGCLSFPDYLVTVKRARKVSATWLSSEGEEQSGDFRDFEAVILQHEVDHLDGVLFLDRVKNIQTDLIPRASLSPG